MVSKRQREARKKFKQSNPELFPTPEPTPPKDPSKKKKKKPNFKRKKSDSNDPKKTLDKNNNNKSKINRKKPLRVPGLKPGDCCFICKDLHHIAKDCPEKAAWERNKICLFCRQRGHSLKNCRNKGEEVVEQKLCYNCGESSHSLSRCPLPLQDGGTKFALCFICNERGHLSKNCPKNTHGIYPKGGCCKICSGVTHLARDCPNKRNSLAAANRGAIPVFDQPRSQVTKLISGDDLEDDFMIEDDTKVKNDSKGDPSLQDNHNRAKANAASGMAVDDECKLKFHELKARRSYRFITFKIEGQQVVVDKFGTPEESYEDFTNALPADECRYAVFDFDFTTDENCQKSKIFFIAWSPDTSRVRMKMVYASSKDRFKRELDGIQVELQATDPSEMSFDIIKGRAI